MERIVWLLLLFLLAAAPQGGWALPVGYVTDMSHERIAVRDIPERGDTPGRVHARYCSEPVTGANVWASVLTPNGIPNDRRMLAGVPIDVRCREFKEVWKTDAINPEVRERLEALQKKIDVLETVAGETKARLVEISASLGRTTESIGVVIGHSGESRWSDFWKDYRFWAFFLLIIIVGLLLAVLVMFGRSVTSSRRGPAPARVSPSTPPMRVRSDPGRDDVSGNDRDVITRTGPETVQATVYVGIRNVEIREFRYTARQGPDERYPGLRPDPMGGTSHLSYDAILPEVHAVLERYLNGLLSVDTAMERLMVDTAIREGRLAEVT